MAESRNCDVPAVLRMRARWDQSVRLVELCSRYVKFVSAVSCNNGEPFVNETARAIGRVKPKKPVETFVTVMLEDVLLSASRRKLKVCRPVLTEFGSAKRYI